MERKLPRNFFWKIEVYLARLSSFLEILDNSVPFATESCRKFKPDVQVEWKVLLVQGRIQDFFLGGGVLVSCSTSTPSINHIVFFLQNTSCIRKPQAISGGRGAHPPHPLPRSAPVVSEVVWTFHLGFEAIMAASYSKRLISTNLRSDFLKLLQQNCILVSNYREYQGGHDHRLDLDDLTDYEFTGTPVRYYKVIPT